MAQENLQAEAQQAEQALPRHVAIIMDGNGRSVNKRKLPRYMGHRQGVKAVRRVAEACLSRRPLEYDRTDVAVRESLDAGVFLTEADAAGQQHDGRVERQAAEVDVQRIGL